MCDAKLNLRRPIGAARHVVKNNYLYSTPLSLAPFKQQA